MAYRDDIYEDGEQTFVTDYDLFDMALGTVSFPTQDRYEEPEYAENYPHQSVASSYSDGYPDEEIPAWAFEDFKEGSDETRW